MTHRHTARLLVVLLVVSVVAPFAMMPAAAAPSGGPTIDAETATTGEESATKEGDTKDDYNASADANFTLMVIAQNGTAPMLQVEENDSDVVHHEDTNPTNVTRAGGGTRWNFTIGEDDLATMPYEAGDNVTIDLVVYNNSSTSSDNNTYHIYLNTTQERSVIYVGDDEVDDDTDTTTEASAENESTWFGLGDEIATSTATRDSVSVNGDKTDVIVVLANTSVADTYADALDRKRLGSFSDGEYVKFFQARIDGNPHPVVNGEAGDALDDTDLTFAEYDEINGEDALTIDLGDEYDDEDTVDVEARGNEKYGLLTSWKMSDIASDGELDTPFLTASGVPTAGGAMVA